MNPEVLQHRLRRAEGRVRTLEALIEDRSRELYEAHEELQRRNDYLESILASMASSVVVVDPAGRIRTANRAALDLLGYAEAALVGQPLGILGDGSSQDLLQDMATLILRGDVVQRELTYRTREGQHVPVLFSSSILRDAEERVEGAVCIAVDLSERRQLQAQLLHSEKLASIGQLAAGIAHEINNPVGFIRSNLGTLAEYGDELTALLRAYGELAAAESGAERERLRAEVERLRQEIDVDYLLEDLTQLVAESREGAERVRKIVTDLREFSHVDRDELSWADLHAGLESTLGIVWNELKYKAEVLKEYGDLPHVECYPHELNQVFMNVLVNAAQAIEEHGTITIRTRHLGGRHDGDRVSVAIADTGTGMTPETQSRIFEPFYTTKEVGKGTGMGLSIAYHIVHKHGGQIQVESRPGEGTTVTVLLPVRAPRKAAREPAS